MRYHQFIGLLYILHGVSGESNETTKASCVVETIPDKERTPVHVFEEYKYVYGFTPDFIGGSIGTVFIQNKTCNPNKLDDLKQIGCKIAVVQSYCHFDENETSMFTGNESKTPFCPLNETDQSGTSPQFKPIRFVEVSQPLKEGLGQYDGARQERFRKYFEECAEDCTKLISVGGIWLCDYKPFLDIYNGKLISKKFITWDMSWNKWLELYLYWFCRVSLPILRDKFKDNVELKAHPFCPNPCSIRRSHCSRLEHTLQPELSSNALYAFSQSNCLKLGKGAFEMEYECLCAPGYSWNSHSRTCSTDDVCATKVQKDSSSEKEPCSKLGTVRCVTIPPEKPGVLQTEELFMQQRMMRNKHHCVCRPGFMGRRCERLKDACIESPSPGQLPGEQACRDFLGNKCRAQNGTNYYFCHCTESWGPDNSYGFPNCYKRRSICDRIICRNRGTCVGSPDQSTYGCQCEEGWTGALCQIPDVRQWLPWGTWTVCSAPFCGGLGWHSRTRECRVPVNESTGFGLCVGNKLEYRPCKSGCIYPLRSYVPMIKVILMFAACLLVLQLSVSLIYALLYMNYL
ncbi:Cadherin tumor suppressor [Fasciola gigantica]|uniref:Cadherin tumor suppressor n=1 Tax=Fasciola gigantica TaxID=46835 RepID=A0A504Y624_FASGI|nr:Cadherin tumor suppressor [Fasciola gigantica]